MQSFALPSESAASSGLVVRDLAKSYGDLTVLDGIDVSVHPGRPVGLVGENGSGKSTLLRCVLGIEQPDAGSVSRPADIGYVAQDLDAGPADTVGGVLADALGPLHDAVARLELLAARIGGGATRVDEAEYAAVLEWATTHDAWDADRRAELARQRLGIEAIPASRRIDELSGGERTRLALAALIARQPDAVVMDEPTNHLDDDACAFVEEFLASVPGVVLVASHDRVFLDRVCAVVVDLDAGAIGTDGNGGRRFGGGFTDYLDVRADARRRWEETFRAQQDEMNALRRAAKSTARQVGHESRPPRDNDKFIPHGKAQLKDAAVSRRVRNVERRLEVAEREQIRKPPQLLRFTHPLGGPAGQAVGPAVSVRKLAVPGRLRLERLDVDRGQHLLVTGPNGSGKSTLLLVLAGGLDAAWSGDVQIRARSVGLLRQDPEFEDESMTARAVFGSAAGSRLSLHELGLVPGRSLDTPVGDLSFGQRRRLSLAVLVAAGHDLVLLDEPTNHISPALAQELEEAVAASAATVLLASHDRWLRNGWHGPTLELSPA